MNPPRKKPLPKPRPTPKRDGIFVRPTDEQDEWIRTQAIRHNVNVSEVIRRAIEAAMRKPVK